MNHKAVQLSRYLQKFVLHFLHAFSNRAQIEYIPYHNMEYNEQCVVTMTV